MKLLLALACAVSSMAEPRWMELNRGARAAAEAKDYQKLRELLIEMRPLMPGNPRVAYNLAASNAQLGSGSMALSGLRNLAAAGLIYDFAKDDDFGSIQKEAQFAAIERQVEANKQPVTRAKLAFALEPADLIPEDIAYDSKSKRFLICSVRQKRIQWSDGQVFASTELPVMALAVDQPRRKLWAALTWVPHCEACNAADEGKSALTAFDLNSGAVLQQVAFPEKGMLGDMTISPRGEVFVSEGLGGSVWRLPAGANQMERIDAPGEFPSPQQPALSSDGKTLYVPDYVRGIAAITLANRAVRWLQPANDVILSGIDGLHVSGKHFIAVQNGTNPARIVRFSLDLQRQQVLEANWPGLGEPTHGIIVNGAYYFIANAGWNSYDAQGRKKEGGAPVKSTVYTLPLN